MWRLIKYKDDYLRKQTLFCCCCCCLFLCLFLLCFVFTLFFGGVGGGGVVLVCRPMCVSMHASVCACMQVKTHCTLSLQQKLYDNSVFVKTIMGSLHKENN